MLSRGRVWRDCFIWKKWNTSFAPQKQHLVKRLRLFL